MDRLRVLVWLDDDFCLVDFEVFTCQKRERLHCRKELGVGALDDGSNLSDPAAKNFE
jgi:hypothetical protein